MSTARSVRVTAPTCCPEVTRRLPGHHHPWSDRSPHVDGACLQVLEAAHTVLLNVDSGNDPLRLLRRAETILSRRSDLLLVLEHCHSARDRKVRRSPADA